MNSKNKTKIDEYFLDAVEEMRGVVWRKVVEELLSSNLLNLSVVYPYCANRFVEKFYEKNAGLNYRLQDILVLMSEQFDVPLLTARNYYYSLHNRYNSLSQILQ